MIIIIISLKLIEKKNINSSPNNTSITNNNLSYIYKYNDRFLNDVI